MSSTDASANPPDSPDTESAEAQGLLFDGDFSPLPIDLGFRGPVACSAAGITYRQLDYWARTGLVVPEVRSASGSGSQRLYSFRDILILKVIKRLIDAGISLQQIRTAIEHLRARGVQDLTQVTLMSDGVSVFECTSDDEVIDLLRGGQGVFGIALGGVWRDIEGTLAELPAERAEAAEPHQVPRRAISASSSPRHWLSLLGSGAVCTRTEATFDPTPFDIEAARAYSQIHAAAGRPGRGNRGGGFADLLIAATALAEQLPLVTRNSKDFEGLEDLITVVQV